MKELDIELPEAPQPGSNYITHQQNGDLLYLAGVISFASTGESWSGQVGKERDLDDGYQAARICALNALATIRSVTGTLDAIDKFISVNGYVNAIPSYGESPSVINGASDLFVELFGESGRHARTAVSVAGLPRNATVEIQVTVELK